MEFADVTMDTLEILAFYCGLYYNVINYVFIQLLGRDTVKKLWFLLGLCLVLMFSGCGGQSDDLEVPTYTVTFIMRGQIRSEQQVKDGHLPKSVMTNVPGLEFVRWCDENGETVNPYTTFVHRDIFYEAEAYPEMKNHVPFLFLDQEGNVRPDDPLTADELNAGLEALASEDARAYFPSMPAGDQKITLLTLTDILIHFFPEQSVRETFVGSADKIITRTFFARGMQTLLGRDLNETLSMDTSVQLANDITREREDAISLMEASMAHIPNTGEHVWTELQLPIRYQPGFVLIDGYLYYVQNDYLFMKSGYVGSLYFGTDGKYTSGNTKLDGYVVQIITQLREENPRATRQTLLRAAYDYCVAFTIERKDGYEFGHTGWEIEEALVMFQNGSGDSYNFAAAFWALARGLGYEANAISGTRGAMNAPHGWVSIPIEEQDWYYDPERERNNAQNMFMLTEENLIAWSYQWTK